ncbi:glyoxylate/hydroxypyruvate reductase A [Thalassobaculum fulvum]|uniref:Glyoxylate/hydroxypyruvate reductase A n=1 Tax=Thalassobaculum fulvum TaxID=1633335 RepID=A0A919CQV0_9PROT|nr:glyoxylate/hydroxypyruvate reductase A [Thalassobaculum fulvum]
MGVILVHIEGYDPAPWIDELKRQAPDLDARARPDVDDPAAVEVAITWRLPFGVYRTFPNLRLIQSMAAGVDHILADPERPPRVPVARVVDPWMARSMVHHVTLAVLRWHRRMDWLEGRRATASWPTGIVFDADAVRVGVLGLGNLGQAVARAMQDLGFEAAGWSRSPKAIDGLVCHHGPDGLRDLAAWSSVLVCLLPLTAETAGILNAGLFALMPEGSLLVNVGRGGHLVEDDLTAALDSGRLAAAALDVFGTEPLPAGHRFWGDNRIYLTPHIASEINPVTATRAFVENIRRVRAGEAPVGLIDPAKGY